MSQELKVTVETTKENLKELINGDVTLKVDVTTPQSLEHCLQTITDLENLLAEDKKAWRIDTDLKGLPFELRKAAIKWALNPEHYDSMIDPNLLVNVFNLIKGYSSFDSSFFESKHIFVNSMVELADLKRELKDDITKFMTIISTYYLSILRSAGVTEYMPADTPKKLPAMIHCIFTVIDFITLSSILRKSNPVSTTDLFNVENASGYLLVMSNKYVLSNIVAEDTFTKAEGDK